MALAFVLVLTAALAAGGALSTGAAAGVGAPSIASDRPDYAPGEMVTLRGTGWGVGEVVHINVNDNARQTWSRDADVTADLFGNVTDEFVLPDWFVAVYTVTATGPTSGTAGTTFTDGNVKAHAAPAGTTFTLTKTSYASTNCTTGAGTTQVITGVDEGGNATGVGSAESVKLEAAATSDQGGTFVNWTTSDPFSNAGPRTICVPGFSGGGGRDYFANYSTNSPPTVARDNATVTVNEGQTASNTGTWSDVNAGNVVTLTASVGTVTKSGTNASGTWTWSFNTTDGPNETQTVTITASDGTASTSTTFGLTVNNVAPTATFPTARTLDEGGASSFAFASPSDPSSADTSAGFHYAFSCTGASLAGATYASSGTTPFISCTFDDGPSTPTVRGRIIDKDNGFTEYATAVTVDNAAPTATFNVSSPVAEGSNIALSLTGPLDPSSADTAAGFEYAFDCGSGYGAFGASNSAGCATTDNGSRTVKGKIRDKDGGLSEYSATVTITNAAPTAAFNAPDSVDEGSNITVSLADVVDPGTADTHQYRFSCDSGSTWTSYGNSNTHSCPTTDNGTKTVNGQVRDDDGGESPEYSKTVAINNVAPTATFSNNGPVTEGNSFTLTMSDGDDASSDDKAAKFTFAFNCGSGYGAYTTTPSLSASTSCTTNDNGGRTVKAKIRDKDGGEREYTDSVTITNVAPTATFNTPDSVNEGSNIDVSFTDVVDPGTADTHQYRFSCDGGSTWTSYGNSNTHSCPTTDNGTKTVNGQVRDDDGGESPEYSKLVAIKNVAPTATFNAPDSVDEGSDIDISLTSVVDPGIADTHQYRFSCDGGSTWTSYGNSNTHTCATTDNGTKTVNGRVRDDDGGESPEYSKTVTIKNVAPTATFSNDGPVDEGSSFTLTMSNADDASSGDKAAKFTFAFDCGDGTGYGAWSSPASLSAARVCATDDNGSRTVKAKILDKDGGERVYMGSVTVRNLAPSATFDAPSSVNEGQSINLSLTSPSDPSSVDTGIGFSYAFDCGSGYGAFSTSSTTSCPTTDNGTRTVKGKIRDKDGGENEYTRQVTVGNVAPQVTVTSPEFGKLYAKPATVAMTASFTDAGTSDTHICSLNWDDTTSSVGTVTEAGGSGTCTGSHSYTVAGVYAVKVTVSDDDGGSTTVEWMVIVYDPNGGFVTGGGWIDVREGSYPADGTLAGRANFGFNSQYKKGATVPTGETEFQFKVGNLNFHSTKYDFLVVSGFKSQYKGVGDVNGVPGFSFRLTAYDGALMSPSGFDKFRIKISDATGAVIFDNRLGMSDDIDAADPQTISGGSIVIHKP